jgi:hypothetical protein
MRGDAKDPGEETFAVPAAGGFAHRVLLRAHGRSGVGAGGESLRRRGYFASVPLVMATPWGRNLQGSSAFHPRLRNVAVS